MTDELIGLASVTLINVSKGCMSIKMKICVFVVGLIDDNLNPEFLFLYSRTADADAGGDGGGADDSR